MFKIETYVCRNHSFVVCCINHIFISGCFSWDLLPFPALFVLMCNIFHSNILYFWLRLPILLGNCHLSGSIINCNFCCPWQVQWFLVNYLFHFCYCNCCFINLETKLFPCSCWPSEYAHVSDILLTAAHSYHREHGCTLT